MKINYLLTKSITIATAGLIFFSACTDKKSDPAPVYTSDPVGTQTTLKTGTLVHVDGPATSGTLGIVQDGNNNQFVKLNSDFKSGFTTGTVVVYLAKTSESIKTQRNGGTTASNVQAVGFVSSNGEHFIKIPTSSTGFSYVVLYCETAEINFGTAILN